MAKRSCADCARTAGVVMRVLVSLNLLAGICLLVFGTTVERPINSFPPVAMILLAVLSFASAITGLVGGHKWACCLDAFLALHSLNTLCQLILVAVLFSDFHSVGLVEASIDPRSTGRYDRAHVTEVLKAAKWLMLVFLICGLAALVLSLLIRFVLQPPTSAFDNFDEDNMQLKAQSMTNLRVDVEAAGAAQSSTSNSVYKKIKGRMAKYNSFTHGIKFKKSWFGF